MMEQFKKAFPETTEWIHLNNAGMALTAGPAKAVAAAWLERFHVRGAHCGPEFLQAIEHSRVSLAKLIGCKPTELGFFQSTSGAVSQAAFGMELQSGDEILTWDQEYPSNSLPWRVAAERAGATLTVVPSGVNLSTPVERLINAITPRTKVIAISWVQYQTGAMTDLQRLSEVARARNIWTVVDVIQGLGQLPFDFASSGVDVICGGSHKWMMSLVGAGFIAIREERVAELRPLMIGTETFAAVDLKPDKLKPDEYKQEKKSAAKFEPGSKQFLEIAALGAAAELLLQTGVAAIADEIHQRVMYLREGLQKIGCEIHCPHGGKPQGAIVNFSRGGLEGRARFEALLHQHKVSYSQRASGIRFSPHVYTSERDIDRVLAILK